MATYQVVGECAYATTDTALGRTKTLLYRDAFVDEHAPELEHLLASGLVKRVDRDDVPPEVPVTPAPPGGQQSPPAGSAAPSDDGSTVGDDTAARRAAASAKLPADGSLPDSRAAKDVWVEAAVTRGYDYTTAAASSKDELRELLGAK